MGKPVKNLFNMLKNGITYLLISFSVFSFLLLTAALVYFGETWLPGKETVFLSVLANSASKPGFLLTAALFLGFIITQFKKDSFITFIFFSVFLVLSFTVPHNIKENNNAFLAKKNIVSINRNNYLYIIDAYGENNYQCVVARPNSTAATLSHLASGAVENLTLRELHPPQSREEKPLRVNLNSRNPFTHPIYHEPKTLSKPVSSLRNYYLYIDNNKKLSLLHFIIAVLPFIVLMAGNSVFLSVTPWKLANILFYITSFLGFLALADISQNNWNTVYPIFFDSVEKQQLLPAILLLLYSTGVLMLRVIISPSHFTNGEIQP